MNQSAGDSVPRLVAAVDSVRKGDSDSEELRLVTNDGDARNQFLFFMKPELTSSPRSPEFSEILRIVLSAFERFAMKPERWIVRSGRYLERHGIVAKHYGVIDSVARDPGGAMSEAARWEFFRCFGVMPEAVTVAGALSYLARHPGLDSESLARDWLERGYTKLAGGTYCQYRADEGEFLFNGFYPRLFERFTSSDRTIVSFVLESETSWKTARQDMVGGTSPSSAVPGSLRRELLERREELRIAEISTNLNGVHLSAGPVEGLAELRRFVTNLDEVGPEKTMRDFAFGRALLSVFSTECAQRILENSRISTEGKETTVYDLTEEMDSEEAIEALRSLSSQFV